MKFSFPYLCICANPQYSRQIAERLRVLPMQIKQNYARGLEVLSVGHSAEKISNRIGFSRAGAADYSGVAADQKIQVKICTNRLGASYSTYGNVSIFVTRRVNSL